MSTPRENMPYDLDWLAFCYVAGELEGAELASFEQLLGESQSARERLAEVVDLTLGIATCEARSDTPSMAAPLSTLPATAVDAAVGRASRRVAFSRSIIWLGVGAAVVLAAVWLGRQFPNRNDVASSTSATEDRQVELAAAWASWLDDDVGVARGDIAAEYSTTEYNSIESPRAAVAIDEPLDAPFDEPVEAPLDEPVEAPLDAPDWMLAALGGEETSSDAPPDAAETNYDDMETDPLHDDGAQDG
ncbi:MAG: hypothetical protein WD875_11650 [Pirellulales bacterium]